MVKQATELLLPARWEVGQHLAIVGDTGSGKSTLAALLLSTRRYLLVLRTKPDTVRYGAVRTETADALRDGPHERLVLAPKYEHQAREIAHALDLVWRQGGLTVYVDELFYASQHLRLSPFIDRLLTQGRSKGISVVTGMQRPVQVSRFALSQSTHVLAFAQEARDAKLLGEATSKQLEGVVNGLARYEFAWYDRIARSVWTGNRDKLKGGTVSG